MEKKCYALARAQDLAPDATSSLAESQAAMRVFHLKRGGLGDLDYHSL